MIDTGDPMTDLVLQASALASTGLHPPFKIEVSSETWDALERKARALMCMCATPLDPMRPLLRIQTSSGEVLAHPVAH